MKRNFLKLASIIGLTVASQNLKADILVGPGGAFQPWTSAVLGPATKPTFGTPYWNNNSGDGPTANIGWCLTGTGGCVIASPPGAIQYFGTSTGAAVQNMAFVSQGAPATVALLGQLTNQLGTAANSGYNVFGWYTISATGVITASPLWNSKTDAIGQTATFTPGPAGTQYGLFLEHIQGGGTGAEADYLWFMKSSSDKGAGTATAVDTTQHFAVFSGTPNTYYIGINDTNNGNQDYNDMIVELVTAPEPRTLTLLGTGLLLCGGLILRRRKLTA